MIVIVLKFGRDNIEQGDRELTLTASTIKLAYKKVIAYSDNSLKSVQMLDAYPKLHYEFESKEDVSAFLEKVRCFQ